MYAENSCLYIFTGDTLLSTGRRIGSKPLLFPMREEEAHDIDTEHDWNGACAH